MANKDCSLKIINAGALHRVIGDCRELFLAKNPGITLEMKGVGSREGAKRLLSGEKYDIVALADQALFAELLVPELVENYFVFATDQIVIGYHRFSQGNQEINQDNWADILLQPGVKFARSDHNLDPCGYRSLMVWQLAEKFYQRPGLANQLEKACIPHTTYPKSLDLAGALMAGEVDYAFLYSSEAKQLGFPYLSLPSKINLSNPAYADYYDQAFLSVESKIPGKNIIIHGKPIEFAVGIVKTTQHPELAQAFIDLLTGPEGHTILEENGMVPC
ncbi:extracellular solute-binding protein [Desulforamulus ferrireducens]|uniref:Molybdenum ABC transporter substrate-binding protein n=1 Tax=Desulforamulus ferrireducens TaxID=1833852 RepID=A0A1S6IZH5_9FIRM|nr:extracellular solute-binding protein [Desulforamulus ferrireducens]AQS60180.1 molybdenum ABC transporter substrate-binding protein [Desulforamulus ferrireducens]